MSSGIADNTIVMYSTDNGPHMNTWPDGAHDPFRSEKNTNWEGAFRVPLLVRWPGKIAAGIVSNEHRQHHDWLPTFLAAAGEPDIVEKLKKGHKAGGKTFKVHIDGYNLLPYLTGEETEEPAARSSSISPTTAICVALRFDNWKVVFMEQRAPGRCGCGRSRSSRCAFRSCSICEPTHTSAPTSPRTPTRIGSWTTPTSSWRRRRSSREFLATFKEFPPRQKAASFTIDQAMEKMTAAAAGGGR